jgi:sulfite exporter TauE/SafE
MWLAAVLMGLAGSIHCAAMCGPLAMAVSHATPGVLASRLLYNGGRIIVYALLGSLVSTVGGALPIQPFQNVLSLMVGGLLLAAGLGGVRLLRIPKATQIAGRLTEYLKCKFAVQLKRKSKLSVALLGAINGLLPCGLTSIALASCLTLDRVVDGFSFMLLFGAGTLPAMLGLTGIVAWFARKHVLSTQALMTVLLIVSGCLLIIRVLVMTHHSSGTGSGFAEILCK